MKFVCEIEDMIVVFVILYSTNERMRFSPASGRALLLFGRVTPTSKLDERASTRRGSWARRGAVCRCPDQRKLEATVKRCSRVTRSTMLDNLAGAA